MDPALLEALAAAVRDLHPSNLTRLETRLAVAAAGPHSVIALALDIPQPGQRETLSRLSTSWKSSPNAVTPVEIVSAMQALRYAVQHETRAEVCWSGPVSTLQGFRTTAEAYRELISKATRTALVMTFALGEVEALRQSLEAALTRGIRVRLVIEDFNVFTQASWRSQFSALGAQVLGEASIFVWPTKNRRQHNGHVYGSMHVKCVVVDGSSILLTSANLTSAAMDDNMELGVVVSNQALAQSVTAHFDHLITTGVLAPMT